MFFFSISFYKFDFFFTHFVRYPAKVNLHSPNLPTKYPDTERESYKATREKQDDLSVLANINKR